MGFAALVTLSFFVLTRAGFLFSLSWHTRCTVPLDHEDWFCTFDSWTNFYRFAFFSELCFLFVFHGCGVLVFSVLGVDSADARIG